MRLIRSMRRHWGRWLIGAVVVVAIVVVGGPFVFFHFIEGPAPAPLSLSSEASTTVPSGSVASAATTADVDGVWDVTSGSQAGYRVQEILFGQSHTAVGRTSSVTGSLTISATTVTAGRFSVDLTKVTSDESLRDGAVPGPDHGHRDVPHGHVRPDPADRPGVGARRGSRDNRGDDGDPEHARRDSDRDLSSHGPALR